ncbi:Uncharacterized protein APZ42_017304 [Daphnia magna]|uniref:Uncharacterized protein n=1 Tax=Daphnia magna TaxID=35525 RepID=A0A164ZRR4_9CRUS|nr:Uncharacterized protein APZ42_017304 [Daphnia magna]
MKPNPFLYCQLALVHTCARQKVAVEFRFSDAGESCSIEALQIDGPALIFKTGQVLFNSSWKLHFLFGAGHQPPMELPHCWASEKQLNNNRDIRFLSYGEQLRPRQLDH